MIASNYRKFPDAMALQLVLVFGRCTWHTARPTQRLARAVRAARAVLVKETPQLVRWVKKATPDWFKEAKRAARELAKQVKAAMGVFVWDEKAVNVECWKSWPGVHETSALEKVQAEAMFAKLPHIVTSVTFKPMWHGVMTRWVHLGLDTHAWAAQRGNGYRG